LYRTAIKAKQKACRFELCAFVFYQKPPMAAKRRSLRLPKILFSPLKTYGFCSAKPKKKSAVCAQISRKVRSWWNFTTPLEPILRKNAERATPAPPNFSLQLKGIAFLGAAQSFPRFNSYACVASIA
jgi:hypothetical protein